MRARFLLLPLAVVLLLIAGCAHGSAAARSGGATAGEVVARADGFTERPSWADVDAAQRATQACVVKAASEVRIERRDGSSGNKTRRIWIELWGGNTSRSGEE